MSALRNERAGFGFDGGTAYIYAPFDWFGYGDWTVAVWFYHGRATRDEVLVNAATAPGRTGYFRLIHHLDGRVAWEIRASNTNNYYGMAFWTVAPLYRWNHVAVRRLGTTINCFINGVKDPYYVTVPLTEEMTYSDVFIGRRQVWGWWLGLVGPLLIYKRALSDSEITMLYNGYVVRDGLALYYDPSIPLRPDGRVEDLSGNGRHGTVYGGLRVGVYRAARTLAPARVLPKAR